METAAWAAQYIIKPWVKTIHRKRETDLMDEWRALADQIGREWRGGSAVEEIRAQRTHDYDCHD